MDNLLKETLFLILGDYKNLNLWIICGHINMML
ncbi:hypothetical protein BD780_002890 [Clostridium tetanomorphum]|nr:hypothetical protein [Clostridium tetanomorphum]NRS85665.1 hypothetical protein [Clostridium tetanomorphum]NRZ96324.1 hypothetical protein [Clostridium tetanomorphum]